MKEHFKIMGVSTVYWIWLMVLLVVGSLISLAFYGVQLNLQRRAQTNSAGFVQAQVDNMSKDITQFQKNEVELAKFSDKPDVVKALKAQQMGIVIDMWSAYDQIPQTAKDSVPTDIRMFLVDHNRNWQPN
jgi:hypothetical protein